MFPLLMWFLLAYGEECGAFGRLGAVEGYDPKYIDNNESVLWHDPPGSKLYNESSPEWYEPLKTWSGEDGKGSKFLSGDFHISANMNSEHGAVHLYADPQWHE